MGEVFRVSLDNLIGMYFAVRIEIAREEGKRLNQKVLLAAGSATLVVIIALIMTVVMKSFS